MHDLVALLNVPSEIVSQLPDVSTAGGLMMALFGRIPYEGETTCWLDRTVEIVDLDGTRIDKILIHKPEQKG
jgi:CBS domain containing-hemolysin-like protein